MKLQDISENVRDENIDLDKAPSADGEWITTAQAAKILGVTMGRIRQLIMDGRLNVKPPEKGRRDNLVSKSQINDMAKKERKPTGRPKGT